MSFSTDVIVLGVTVLLASLAVRFLRSYRHFRKLELAIPGPPSLPLLGNMLDLAGVTPDNVLKIVFKLIDGRRELCRCSVFGHMIVFVSDPAEIEELVKRKDFEDKSAFVYSLLHVIATKGLLQLNGSEWKRHRKWLQPGFSRTVVNSFVRIFSEEAKGFMSRLPCDEEVEVMHNLKKTSVRNVLRTSITSDFSRYEEDIMQVVEFVECFTRSVNRRSFNPLLWSDKVFSLTPLGRALHRMNKSIEFLVGWTVATKRAEMEASNNCDLEQGRKSFMDALLGIPERGEPMSDDAIMDEFKTVFIANIDTSVSSLGWVLKTLSMEAKVQERVYEELRTVFQDSDRDVTAEDIAELKYLDRVVKECLRMLPPAPMIGRQCHAETQLCGRTIPAGATVLVNIFGAHRDPKYWHRPELFDPDRFLAENSVGRHPYAYMPFSMGPRNCIGRDYATVNLKTFLATVLRDYRILAVADHKDLQSLADNMTFDLTSSLVGGVRLRFQRRARAGANDVGN